MITLAKDQRDLTIAALNHYRLYLEQVSQDCANLHTNEGLEVYSEMKRKADRVGVVSVLMTEAALVMLDGTSRDG